MGLPKSRAGLPKTSSEYLNGSWRGGESRLTGAMWSSMLHSNESIRS